MTDTNKEQDTNEEQDKYKGSLIDIIDQNLEEVITIIKDNYPDIDIFSKMRYSDPATIKAAINLTKEKYPGVKLFYVDIPYYGVIVYRSQTMKDTREIAEESVSYSEKLIEDNGGIDAINKKEDIDQRKIRRDIQDKVNDLININMLKKCVLFPETFVTNVETEAVPYGVIPVLLDVLSESSGFQNVRIEEI